MTDPNSATKKNKSKEDERKQQQRSTNGTGTRPKPKTTSSSLSRPPPLIKRTFIGFQQQQQSLINMYKITQQRSIYQYNSSQSSSSMQSSRYDVNNVKFSRNGKDKLELSMDVSGKRFTGVLRKKQP